MKLKFLSLTLVIAVLTLGSNANAQNAEIAAAPGTALPEAKAPAASPGTIVKTLLCNNLQGIRPDDMPTSCKDACGPNSYGGTVRRCAAAIKQLKDTPKFEGVYAKVQSACAAASPCGTGGCKLSPGVEQDCGSICCNIDPSTVANCMSSQGDKCSNYIVQPIPGE